MRHQVRHLDLFVTEACNLACPYCFASARPRRNPSLDHCLRAVDWLVDEGSAEKVHVTLWGGEPLLRFPLLERVVGHARERAARRRKRITFSMPTNATLLDDEALAWLRGNDVQVFLSIDGDADAQAGRPLAAGGSSHALATRGLRRALAHRMKSRPSVRMTVTPRNVGTLAHNVSYFMDSHVHELLVYAALDTPWDREAIEQYACQQMDLVERYCDRFVRAAESGGLPVLKAWRPILRRLARGGRARRRLGCISYCGAGTRMVAVGVDGSFHPCHRFVFYARDHDDELGRRLDLGSFERGLELDRGRSIGELRIEQMQGRTRCIECEIFDLCTFSCVAINYATTGTLDHAPETACALMAAQVGACREAHSRLSSDPRYARVLGQPVAWALGQASRDLGQRAWEIYRSLQPREGTDVDRAE